MNRKYCLALVLSLIAVGCSHAEPEPDLSHQISFADQRKEIMNNPNIPPAAKEGALLNVDRMEAMEKK